MWGYNIDTVKKQHQRGTKMIKVTGLNELALIIEDNNMIEKAEKKIKKDRIKELISQGIDKEIAKVMVEAGIACGVQI